MIGKIVAEIDRFGFSFTENVIAAADLRAITSFFDEHKHEFTAAKVGPQDNRQRVESIRGDHTLWIDPLAPEAAFKPVLKFLETLREALNSRFYLGLKQFECHLAYYPAGSFYKKHSDRFETSSSRSLSFVFYLNSNWESSDGGELILFDKNDNALKSFSPMPGSFVCFMSEDFPHEVKSGLKERRSLTGWMHTKIIY
jgi:SM-20-related protein